MTLDRLLILGASGDLAGRYLLGALAELLAVGRLRGDLDIVGISHERWDDDAFRAHARRRLDLHAPLVPAVARRELAGRLRHVPGDATDARTLAGAVAGAQGPVAAYLALPPGVFAGAITAFAASNPPPGSRIVVEKPFGTGLESAQELNHLLHRHFPESSTFRMDHFLGKQTVQNLLGLRFANRLIEPVWCAEHVARVDVVWEETVALEGRAGYYDSAGALRDMVQNHLLQLLALVAMERPSSLGEGPLRDARVAALRAVRRPDRAHVECRTVRARYTAGTVGGRDVPDYVAEPGVQPDRGTESFAEVELFLDHDRWTGVPFRLRTGKALGRDRRMIRLTFRPVDVPFGQPTDPGPNRLTLTMDPDQVVAEIALNGTGDPFCLDPARWELRLAPQEPSAYARLLADVIDGDAALSIRGDEAEECWRIVEPILAGWHEGTSPLRTYPAGSPGPEPAEAGTSPR